MIRELTDSNFWQEVGRSSEPYIVDFWAIWSQSCLAMSQVLEDIAKKYEGRLNVGKVNVDNEIKIANDCKIQNIPTLIFYSGSDEIARIVGTITSEVLISKIKSVYPKIKKSKSKRKEKK